MYEESPCGRIDEAGKIKIRKRKIFKSLGKIIN
jgi:hypothetical protein